MKNIHKHIHMPHMYVAAILGSVCGIIAGMAGNWAVSAEILSFISWRYGTAHVLGTFDSSWGGGNAGLITLITATEERTLGGSGLSIDTNPEPDELSGNIFLETVGWVTMTGVQIVRGSIPVNDQITPRPLNGYAWSANAGYIDFTAQDGTYSGVAYIPDTRSFTGTAWSENLGYITFGRTDGQAFRNRILVLGNIGGTMAAQSEVGLTSKFDSASMATAINSVRKNVALVTRNSTQVNTTNTTTKALNGVVYYKNSGYDFVANKVKASNIGTNRTLIVEGGDIIIDANVANGTTPKAIIAIKDAKGNGGNIYITSAVKNIYASLVAEGTIYSGDSSANLYNDSASERANSPATNQLYILGSAISRNTIWGANPDPTKAICPFSAGTCGIEAYKYDWNYFRTYDGKTTSESAKTGYNLYSVIIESDGRLLQNPPPGLAK